MIYHDSSCYNGKVVLSNGWVFIRSHFYVSIFLLRTGISSWHTEITCLDIYATVITVVALSQHNWYMIGIFSSYCKPYDKTNIRDFANSTQTQIKCSRKLRNKCYLSTVYTCHEHNSSCTRDYKLFAILCLHCVLKFVDSDKEKIEIDCDKSYARCRKMSKIFTTVPWQ